MLLGILLGILQTGITLALPVLYLLYTYNTTKRVNKVCRHSGRYSPAAQMFLCCLIPFYFIYWGWRQGDRLDTDAAKRGLRYAPIGPSCMWMGLIMPLIAVAIVRNRAKSLEAETLAQESAV